MRIPVDLTGPQPDQPRGHFEEQSLRDLGQNMVAHSQQIPIIVYEVLAADKGAKRYLLIDGERRWRAAQIVGIKELEGIVLKEKPSAAKLAIIQASIDVHKVSLSAMERSDLLARIQMENGWTVTELAGHLNIKQSMASKLLAIQVLSLEAKRLLKEGKIDIERAYMLTQTSDPALVQQAPSLTRDQLRQKIKSKGKPDVKTSSVRLGLPGNYVLLLKGPSIDLPSLGEILQEAYKQIRKAEKAGHDVASVQRLLK